MRSLTVAAVLLAFTASAEDVPPETIAKIRAEQKAAAAAVDKKYEGKKLTKDDRKAMEAEKNEAAQKVLDNNKVDAKSFARSSAKMGRDDAAAADATQKGIEKKAEDDAKAAADKKKKDEAKGKEVVVERGGKGGKAGPAGGPPGSSEGDAAEAAAADREAGLGKGK
jgi:hypothetical protein